jgi:hypothetical protein
MRYGRKAFSFFRITHGGDDPEKSKKEDGTPYKASGPIRQIMTGPAFPTDRLDLLTKYIYLIQYILYRCNILSDQKIKIIHYQPKHQWIWAALAIPPRRLPGSEF